MLVGKRVSTSIITPDTEWISEVYRLSFDYFRRTACSQRRYTNPLQENCTMACLVPGGRGVGNIGRRVVPNRNGGDGG